MRLEFQILGFVALAGGIVCASDLGCSANGNGGGAGTAGTGHAGSSGSQAGSGGTYLDPDTGSSDEPIDTCSAAAKVIYIVSEENDLWSFDPTQAHMASYKKIGTLHCSSSSSPQSMSVDKDGKAWVFYDDGSMYWVSTADASCTLTNYKHPVAGGGTLGMGFTATQPNVLSEVLYIVSPDFGLATVDETTFKVTELNVLNGATAELTGGMDALLFMFDASNNNLSQINLTNNYQTSLMHTFSSFDGVSAWAFARYDGVFYMFTSDGASNTKTTMFDPTSNLETVRDPDIGSIIVGAGQSICVPQPAPK